MFESTQTSSAAYLRDLLDCCVMIRILWRRKSQIPKRWFCIRDTFPRIEPWLFLIRRSSERCVVQSYGRIDGPAIGCSSVVNEDSESEKNDGQHACNKGEYKIWCMNDSNKTGPLSLLYREILPFRSRVHDVGG